MAGGGRHDAGHLTGVIDLENAGFTDPVYECRLPFFVSPGLRQRGDRGALL